MYMTKGNLLTANAYQIETGLKSVTLHDYESDENIEIALDESLCAIDNAKKYFALYNKNKKAYTVAQEMIEKTNEEIMYYKQLLYDIDTSETLQELKDTAAEIEPQSIRNTKSNNKKETTINITKLNFSDFTIYIGKNSKQNDYLYSKISSGNDMWFHVLNTPGSHIIVKSPNTSTQIPDNIILKAAQLAKEFSTAKNSSKTAVVYTMRKYIKRPNNTKSGFVVYKNETEIIVD